MRQVEGKSMGHVTRNTDRAMIDIDTTNGQILLAQKWAYRWHKEPGQSDWTRAEKNEFHHRSDLAIWAVWSNRAHFLSPGHHYLPGSSRGGCCR
jgi:hypothetical protein